jgi:small subunit ribosomal protein S6e
MTSFKIVIADPKNGKSYKKELASPQADALVGKKIGEEIDGLLLDLAEYKLKIMGGTEKDGFPMRSDLPGGVRKSLLVTEGFGFNPKKEGARKKKMFRGNMINPDIVQINMVITQYGSKSLEESNKEGAS